MNKTLDRSVTAYNGGILYDFDNEILLNWYPERIIALSGEAKSLLELGLGHGYSTARFAKHFKRHVVIDGSPAVTVHFKQRFPDCSAQVVESLFESFDTTEIFDLIVLGFVLEHVDNPAFLISRYARFLEPGGTLYVAVPNAEALNRRLGHIAGLLPNIEELSGNDVLLGHKRYYTVRTLREDVHKAGCEIAQLEGIYLKPFTTKQILDLKLDHRIIDALCEVGIGYPELSCGILAQIQRMR